MGEVDPSRGFLVFGEYEHPVGKILAGFALLAFVVVRSRRLNPVWNSGLHEMFREAHRPAHR